MLRHESMLNKRRRVFLQMGGLSALGMTLSGLLGSQKAVGAGQSSSAKACILLYMTGGPCSRKHST